MMDVNPEAVMADLANYNSKQELFSKQFLWSGVANSTPSTWWLGLCSTKQISKVASRILNLPATSAAVERTFSTYAHVHSQKRNKLSNENASKLVYIAQNLKLLDTGSSAEEAKTHEEAASLQVSLDSQTLRPTPTYVPMFEFDYSEDEEEEESE